MEVYALIGSSGTGKSHRALLVARNHKINHIIDDGLLISDSKILAGRSAKREATGPAAVRRALFTDPQHAASVMQALDREAPAKLLVLGISQKMIDRIVESLCLPPVHRALLIEDVASASEIRRARSIRQHMGKHVIPAPTLEVKKTFSGYLVDSLRFFSRGKRRFADDEVIEKSVVRPTYSSLGRFYISDRVVASVAEYACVKIPGVVSASRIRVDIRDEGVVVQMGVHLVFGVDLVSVLKAAQSSARDAVEHMTALNVLSVDLTAQRLVMDKHHDGTSSGEEAKAR